jgi:hypothetical protein
VTDADKDAPKLSQTFHQRVTTSITGSGVIVRRSSFVVRRSPFRSSFGVRRSR